MAINKLPEFAKDGQKNTDDLVLTDGFPVLKKPARQWFNWLFNTLTAKINEIIDADFVARNEIVDNLTTADAAKVASARTVKELQDKKFEADDLKDASTTQKGIVQLNNTLTSANTDQALTAAQGKVLNDQAFGVGRAWEDVTASRLSGTTYTNTTPKPIQVSIHIRDQPAATSQAISIVCMGVTLVNNAIFEGGGQWGDFAYSFVVPSGGTYSYTRTGSGALTVTELR